MMIQWVHVFVLGLTLLTFRAVGVDMFLELDGVPGESLDSQHPGSIKVLDFSLGVVNDVPAVGGGGAGVGRASFDDFAFTKPIDKSSPLLYLNCASGKHLKKAVLYVRAPGLQALEFYVVTLNDVLISIIRTTGSTGDAPPTESVSLRFSRVEFSYRAQKPDGSLEAPVVSSWDLKKNAP